MTTSLANDSNDSEDNNIGLVPTSWRTYSVLCCLQKTVDLFLKESKMMREIKCLELVIQHVFMCMGEHTHNFEAYIAWDSRRTCHFSVPLRFLFLLFNPLIENTLHVFLLYQMLTFH